MPYAKTVTSFPSKQAGFSLTSLFALSVAGILAASCWNYKKSQDGIEAFRVAATATVKKNMPVTLYHYVQSVDPDKLRKLAGSNNMHEQVTRYEEPKTIVMDTVSVQETQATIAIIVDRLRVGRPQDANILRALEKGEILPSKDARLRDCFILNPSLSFPDPKPSASEIVPIFRASLEPVLVCIGDGKMRYVGTYEFGGSRTLPDQSTFAAAIIKRTSLQQFGPS